jgi:hypothetical protein
MKRAGKGRGMGKSRQSTNSGGLQSEQNDDEPPGTQRGVGSASQGSPERGFRSSQTENAASGENVLFC